MQTLKSDISVSKIIIKHTMANRFYCKCLENEAKILAIEQYIFDVEIRDR